MEEKLLACKHVNATLFHAISHFYIYKYKATEKSSKHCKLPSTHAVYLIYGLPYSLQILARVNLSPIPPLPKTQGG